MENLVPEIDFDPSLNDQEIALEDSDDEDIQTTRAQKNAINDNKKYKIFTNQYDKILVIRWALPKRPRPKAWVFASFLNKNWMPL